MFFIGIIFRQASTGSKIVFFSVTTEDKQQYQMVQYIAYSSMCHILFRSHPLHVSLQTNFLFHCIQANQDKRGYCTNFPDVLILHSFLLHGFLAFNPTKQFTILQSRNMSIGNSELHKVRQQTYFETCKSKQCLARELPQKKKDIARFTYATCNFPQTFGKVHF